MCKKILLVSLVLVSVTAGQCFADATDQLQMARRFCEYKDYQQAAAICRSVIADHPGTDNALGAQSQLTIAYIEMGKDKEAQTSLDKLTTDFFSHSDLPEMLYYIATTYGWRSKYSEEISVYQQIIQRAPSSSYADKAQLDIAGANALSSGRYEWLE